MLYSYDKTSKIKSVWFVPAIMLLTVNIPLYFRCTLQKKINRSTAIHKREKSIDSRARINNSSTYFRQHSVCKAENSETTAPPCNSESRYNLKSFTNRALII